MFRNLERKWSPSHWHKAAAITPSIYRRRSPRKTENSRRFLTRKVAACEPREFYTNPTANSAINGHWNTRRNHLACAPQCKLQNICHLYRAVGANCYACATLHTSDVQLWNNNKCAVIGAQEPPPCICWCQTTPWTAHGHTCGRLLVDGVHITSAWNERDGDM